MKLDDRDKRIAKATLGGLMVGTLVYFLYVDLNYHTQNTERLTNIVDVLGGEALQRRSNTIANQLFERCKTRTTEDNCKVIFAPPQPQPVATRPPAPMPPPVDDPADRDE